MKKILALLLVVSMLVVCFAACTEEKETKEPTTAPTTATTDEASDDASDEASDAASDVASDEASDAASDVASDEASDVASDEASDVASDEASEAASDEASDDASDEASDAASDEASDEATDGATDDTTTEGTLKMVTNAFFAPYEYFQGQDIVGIDIDIAKAIAEKLNMNLVVESIAFDSIITTVNSGAADFAMAGMTITEDRLLEVDFTLSYATGCQMLVVRNDSELDSLDDLTPETKVGVQLGTTGALYAEWDGYTVVEYDTANNAIIALKAGIIDCVMIDSAPAQNFVDNNDDLRMIDGEEAYLVEEYAACVKKGNTELLSKLNAAIVELIEDGTIDEIIERYIPSENN